MCTASCGSDLSPILSICPTTPLFFFIGVYMFTSDEHNARLIADCKPFIELHINHLITDYELLLNLSRIAGQAFIPNVNTFDDNTGLKYTPAMVMGYINKNNEELV